MVLILRLQEDPLLKQIGNPNGQRRLNITSPVTMNIKLTNLNADTMGITCGIDTAGINRFL